MSLDAADGPRAQNFVSIQDEEIGMQRNMDNVASEYMVFQQDYIPSEGNQFLPKRSSIKYYPGGQNTDYKPESDTYFTHKPSAFSLRNRAADHYSTHQSNLINDVGMQESQSTD